MPDTARIGRRRRRKRKEKEVRSDEVKGWLKQELERRKGSVSREEKDRG